LIWARTLGTYVYTSPAVADERVFAGTYDGRFFALDAATGDIRWTFNAASAIHGAPVVMRGHVYFGTCPGCATSAAKRFVKPGPRITYALNARTGREVWSTRGIGAYSPLVADEERVYLLGAAHIQALKHRRRN
jgi:outer membrane protein assembly factor BamB